MTTESLLIICNRFEKTAAGVNTNAFKLHSKHKTSTRDTINDYSMEPSSLKAGLRPFLTFCYGKR